jgi:DNA-binding protein Fis
MEKVNFKTRSFLEKWLNKTVKEYVGHMDGQKNGHLFDLIVGGVEKPLVEIVLDKTKGNQTQAANILGINRNTLRKKIKDYEITVK